ncbi:hypothetical protein BCIN_14g03780 [Botrytis cinerea B05.10]|uniref:B30.2/SPRY domain-containing protein n=1 Tax=Botryotinia fuckeliana (strain B05.10) TaxID=332648 RepID=A0A384K320_BOTFB|nr:hypothetical protein BCIN_14g03780 [Botrytis cinerea B05.10]ATZ57220.1 hypothetical protein BCIN_14g03780 [Botrytis cinerea B05.10]
MASNTSLYIRRDVHEYVLKNPNSSGNELNKFPDSMFQPTSNLPEYDNTEDLPKSPDSKVSTDSLWKEAKDLFYGDLGIPAEDIRDDTATIENTISVLKITREKVDKEYGNHELFLGVNLKLGSILKRLELISQVGDAAVKFAPETISLAWAGFRFIFMGFVEDHKACEFLVDAVDSMSTVILTCQIYAQRFLKIPSSKLNKSDSDLREEIKQAIIELYKIVLKLSYQAKKYSERSLGKIGRVFWRLLGDDTDFTSTMKLGKEKLQDLLGLAGIAFQEVAFRVLDDLVIGTAKHLQILENISVKTDQLDNIIFRKNGYDLEKGLEKQLVWLRSGTIAAAEYPGRLHEANKAACCKKACKWVINEANFKEWSQCKEENKLLWVKGGSGVGKSFLVSMIIEHLEEHNPENEIQPLVLYFFCKTGDDTTQRGNKIMLHLISQLLIIVLRNFNKEIPNSVFDGNKLTSSDFGRQELDSCIDIFNRARSKIKNNAAKDDSSLLEINSILQPVLKSLVVALKRRFVIVLDALDECLDYDKGLLSAMIALARSSIMNVLIASRPTAIISKALENYALLIDLDKQESAAKNIQAYVNYFLRRENIFKDGSDERKKASESIKRKANGSFRYANLILEELKSTPGVEKRRKLIVSSLPNGLKDYYRKALKNLESEHRQIIMIALRWLVCAQSKVYVNFIAEEYDQKWKVNREDDGFDKLSIGSDTTSSLSEGQPNRAESMAVSIFELHTMAEQQVIDLLRSAGRKFLQFGNANNSIELDHNSVRDYVYEDEEMRDTTTLCEECRKKNNDSLAFEAGGKYGNLLMIENIMKTLNSESFQKKFIWIAGVDDGKDVIRPSSEYGIDDMEELDPELYCDVEKDVSGYDMEKHEVNQEVVLNDAEHKKQPFQHTYIPEELEERYEVNNWAGHLRAAEKAWPEEQRLQEKFRWIQLYDDVEKFLNPNSRTFKSWVKRTSPWQSMNPINPLHVAAYYGLVGLIKRHAKEKYANTRDGGGLSALHLACYGVGEFLGIELLLPDEKNINRRAGIHQESPLELAIRCKADRELSRKLIDAGADPSGSDSLGRTCLHHAAANGDIEVVKILLDNSANVNAKDEEGETPLHWACKQQKTPPELIELLLSWGADVDVQDNNRQTPLYEACLSGNFEAAEKLLNNSAIVNCIDNFRHTALFAALGWCQTATRSNMKLAELLVSHGADLSITDGRSQDTVARAVALNDIKILEFLLKCWKKKDPEGKFLLNRDFNSLAPLHRAAAEGRDDAVKMLLGFGNGEVSTLCRQPGIFDSTALHLAVKNGHKGIVKAFFDASDPLISLETDECGATPMHWAVSRRDIEIVKILLDKGDISALYMHDKAGATPLHCAINKSNVEATKILLARGNIYLMCLAVDKNGATPMHCAVTMGGVETLRVLLDDGGTSAIDKCDDKGATPLHIAAREGNTGAAELLCSRGADLTLEDKHNRTPLEWMFVAWKCTHPDDVTHRDEIESAMKLLMSKILASMSPTIDIKKQQLDLIHFVMEKGNVNIRRAINKDLVNEKDSHGWTSLLLAFQLQRRDIIDFPLQYDTQNILGTFSQEIDSQSLGYPPTKWSPTCKNSRITITEDGLEASLESSDDLGFHGPVRANHPIPAGRKKYYFEVTVLEIFGKNQSFRLGVAPRGTRWFDEVWSWETGVTSSSYDLDTALCDEMQQYQTRDVIGCGIDFKEKKIFYTKNGKLLSNKTKFIDVARRLFPCIQIGGKKINTRVNFKQELFMYQGWPFDFTEDSSENEEEDPTSGRPTEDSLEAQIVTEFLVEGNIIETQADDKKEGQIMAIIQQRDKQEKLTIDLQVEDRQEQALIGPAPVHQEDCGVIDKLQNNHQEKQKGLNSGIGGIDPAVDNVETIEPPVTPQAPQKREKLFRVLRKLGC